MDASNWKLVVFDFFGVICSDIVDEWLRIRNLTEEAAELREKYVLSADLGKSSFEDVCRGLADRVGESEEAVRKELLGISSIDESVVEIVKKIKRQTKIAICSNAPKGLIEEIISLRGVRLDCDYKIISGELGVKKPSPEIYLEISKHTGLDLTNTIFIDDRLANVEGAEAVGMSGVLFSSAGQLIDQLAEMGMHLND